MKKIILWVLLAALLIGAVIGVAVSCNNNNNQQTEPTTEATVAGDPTGVNDVIAYLKAQYKDNGASTPIDYERFGIVRIAGVPYEVVWTVDVTEEFIKIVVNDDGTVTIDVNEECEADTPYVLTATVTDEYGNTASHSWNYILPEAVDMVAIVKEAYALAPGESLPYECTLRGKITAVKTPYSVEYKNITVIIEIEGAEDMPIECYRLKGEGVDELQIGDIITVTGTLKNYNGTIEFDAGCILEDVIIGDRVQAPEDPRQIVDEAYALGANESLPYEATLTGKITKVDQAYDEFYGNVTVTMEVDGRAGKPIKCYRLKGPGVDQIGVNDLITVRGYITNYVGSAGYSTIEFVAGCQLVEWVDRAEPVAPDDMCQIVDEAYALGPNQSLLYEATLTGKVTKVNTAYDPSFDNVTVTIVVPGREDKPIKCYRMKGDGANIIGINDTITVKGYITNYQHSSGDTEVEFTAGCKLISYELNPNQAPDDMVQIVNEAYALGPNESLLYEATLTGKITKVNTEYSSQYGNVTVTIVVAGAEDKPIKCYRMKGSGADQIDVGDVITVTGYITNYQHSSGDCEVEFNAGCKLVSWTPAEDVEPDTPAVAPGLVENPVADTAYKFGMIQESVSTTDVYYLMGGMNGFYMATSNNAAEAIDVYLEETEGGYYFYTMDGENKLYINMVVSADGAHVNGAYEAEASTVYTYDEEMDTIVATVNDALYRFGTRNDKTYTTVGPVQVDRGNFYCKFYSVEAGSDPTDPTEPDEDGTVLTIAEAIAMGSAMEHNTYTTVKYKVTGLIKEVYSEQYGNMRLVDEAGNILTLYGTWSADGSVGYSQMEVKPVAGDTITIYGPVGQYNGVAQIKNGWIVEHIPAGSTPTEPTEPTTPSVPENEMVVVDAPEAGVAYKFGMIQESVSTTDVYYLMGGMNGFYMATSKNVDDAIDVYLEETEGGYYFYTMDGENKLYINMVVSADGAHVNGAYEAEASTVYTYDEEMDTIVATVNDALYRFGTRNVKTYTTVGPVQVDRGNFYCKFYIEQAVTDPTEPSDPTEPVEDDVLTIAEAIAMGTAMEHNTYTEEKYKVTGLIKEVYSEQYGNMRLVDEAGNILTLYGTWSADGSVGYSQMEVKPVAGDTITIYGPVGQYNGVAQIKNGWIIEHIPGEATPTEPTTPSNGDYITEPVAGTAYKFGMIQENVSATDIYYLKGGMNGFYMDSSKNIEEAIDVYLEETEGGYYFYTMDGENKLYINMVVSADGAHVNGAYEAEASTVYTYDEEMDTIVTTVNDALYRFGTRNDKSYTTIGPVQVEKGNFFCRFYGEKEATDPTEPVEGEVLTIAEAIAMGSAMEHNTYTEEKYKVTGVIETVYQTTYGNMRLMDEAGNVLTIYGTWNADGTVRYDALEVKPVAGDTVTIYGPVGNYDGAAQIKNGWIVEHIPGEPSEGDTAEEPDAQISFADVANRISLSLEQQVWKQNGITVTNDKAASTTDVADYANPARFYKNSKLTIEATGMTKIVVNCNGYKDYATALVDSIPATAGVTVTKDGNTVTIAFASAVNSFVIEALSAGQVRVDSIGIFN